MKAPLSLRKPTNWQDFESLCKSLWGEIWDCDEIVKNGRQGQPQSGVDIYGIPQGKSGYYGIQCKLKNEDLGGKLTIKEIDSEIENAKKFEPKLVKLYFATTANKDIEIEKYVRIRNIESLKNNCFEIHLFSWDDIVDLIEKNKKTFDFFVNSQNFLDRNKFAFTFDDDTAERIFNPKFLRNATIFSSNPVYFNPTKLDKIIEDQRQLIKLFSIERSTNNTKRNLSLIPIVLKLKNEGIEPLENIKLVIKASSNILGIKDSNLENDFSIKVMLFKKSSFKIDEDDFTIRYYGEPIVLVGGDEFLYTKFYIKVPPEKIEIQLDWKFLSKTTQDNGQLKIISVPEISRIRKLIRVDSQNEEKTIEGTIEEYFESI